MTFESYMEDWWTGYVDQCNEKKNGTEWLNEVFTELEYTADDLGEDETVPEFLKSLDAEDIYQTFYGYCPVIKVDADGNSFDTQEFLSNMLLSAAIDMDNNDWSFTSIFVDDMAYYCSGYNSPDGFFRDLQSSGCQSGMIGMLIYNSDCKEIYIEHIDDMEEFVEEFEDEIGCPIKNEDHIPRYTYVCWLCYEELAFRIVRELFPDEF